MRCTQYPGAGYWPAALRRSSTTIVASSSFVRNRFAQLLAAADQSRAEAEIHVLPMGYEPSAAGERVEETVPERSDRVGRTGRVLFLGRVNPIKGLDVLIDACAELDGVVLDVAGYGPALEACRSQAQRLGVAAQFHGQVGESRKWALLDQADVVVVPSRVMPGWDDGRSCPWCCWKHSVEEHRWSRRTWRGIPDLIRDEIEGLLVRPDDAGQFERCDPSHSVRPECDGSAGGGRGRFGRPDTIGRC